jgi:hypothetical protein
MLSTETAVEGKVAGLKGLPHQEMLWSTLFLGPSDTPCYPVVEKTQASSNEAADVPTCSPWAVTAHPFCKNGKPFTEPFMKTLPIGVRKHFYRQWKYR